MLFPRSAISAGLFGPARGFRRALAACLLLGAFASSEQLSRRIFAQDHYSPGLAAEAATSQPGPPLTKLVPIDDLKPTAAPELQASPERAGGRTAAPSAWPLVPSNRETPPLSADAPLTTEGLAQLARSLLLANLPREYENAKDWGHTRPVWDGLHISRDGLQIRTKRRWKNANHGTWTKYRAWLIDPDRELQIRFERLRRVGTHQLAFDMIVDAHVGATGRLSEWNRGVQLYSFHADAEALVQLQVSCQLGLRFDPARLPPDVQLVPRITDAQLTLHDFRLQRISSVDGPLVRRLGESLQGELQRELNERRVKLVEKLNGTLEKNQHHLRLSLVDLAQQGWSQLISSSAERPSSAAEQ